MQSVKAINYFFLAITWQMKSKNNHVLKTVLLLIATETLQELSTVLTDLYCFKKTSLNKL